MRKIVICFDVDGTLRNNEVDQSLPPIANEDIRSLLIILSGMKNTEIIVWSGGGELYARQIVDSFALKPFVDRYADKVYSPCEDCGKPCYHHQFDTDIVPDITIDDIHNCELGNINLIVREK